MSILLKDLLGEKREPKVKTIYKNKWLSMMSKKCPDGDTYIYAHETRCNGNVIAVLLYKKDGDEVKYGVRSERTPCWGDEPSLSSLTGGVDEGNSPIESAIIELKQEAGLNCKKSDLKKLGTCRGTKSSDTTYHLFALDTSGMTTGEATGDDSGKIIWLSRKSGIDRVQCPLFSVMLCRLELDKL